MTFWHQKREKKGEAGQAQGSTEQCSNTAWGSRTVAGPRGPSCRNAKRNYFCKNNSLLIKQCFLMKYHSILHLLFSRSISIALKLHSIYLHVLSAVKIRGVAGRKALRFTLDFSSSVSKMEF